MKLGVTLDILNQKDTPAFYADTLANRPAAGFTGRVFISTDTLDLYRDTGTTWVLLSPSSTGTITGSGAAGQVTYFSAASSITGSNNLFWDTANNRLGVNTNTPTATFDVHGTTNVIAQLNQLTTGQNALLTFQDNSVGKWRLGNIYNAAANDFGIVDILNSLQRLTIKNTGQTFVGTETTSSGLLVVNSSTADNQIVAIGANSPSIRINNGSAAKQVGIGISTGTNNFIQGSADRDFCIFNGSTTAASPMLFGIYDAGAGNVQEAARISAARNFLVGTSVDAGFRLDVNGTARVANSSFTGPGLRFAHTANLTSVITGGTGAENITFGPSNRIFLNASQVNVNYLNGLQTITSPANTSTNIITNVNATNSGPVSGVSITGTQTIQTSGFDGVLTIAPNISAAGGTSSAIVVGLYYNPTLTSLTGTTHRAIQTVTGDVCLGTTSGNLLIGTATSGASKLRIVGLPTSAAGLSSGDVYSNSGILTIVP